MLMLCGRLRYGIFVALYLVRGDFSIKKQSYRALFP